ncbi:flavin reductase family protein [Streptomyces sp. NPDC087844]|uniref:flavin reductase family protein n=1 Tax=Streptomyces sp. NPDC087844 TaxID=3365805 RepID=UPI00380A0DF7
MTGSSGAAGSMEPFLDRLDTPVYVVTAHAGGERAGCLVGFAAQGSIRPARFMVWLSKVNRTYRVARSAPRLAVHLLGRDQYALAELFGGETGDGVDGSGRRVDKFARAAWTPGPGGVPVLDGVPAWFVGQVEGRVDAGDHVGFLLGPIASGAGDGPGGPGGPGGTGGTGGPREEPLRLSDVSHIAAGHPAG